MVTYVPYDRGMAPCCAIDTHGRVVALHSGETFGRLYWRIGTAMGAGLTWEELPWGYHHFSNGFNPTVALNDDGVLVAVHESNAEAGGDLRMWVGCIRGNGIAFTTCGKRVNNQHPVCADPAIAMDRRGRVLQLYCADDALFCRRGHLRGTVLTWQPEASRLASHGNRPTIAMNQQGLAIAMFDSRYRLYYMIGRLGADDHGMTWTAPREYASGINPSVALTEDGTVYEVHASPAPYDDMGTILHRLGWVEDDRICWQEGMRPGDRSHAHSSGVAPHVACNGKALIRLRASAGGFPATLFSAASVVAERPVRSVLVHSDHRVMARR